MFFTFSVPLLPSVPPIPFVPGLTSGDAVRTRLPCAPPATPTPTLHLVRLIPPGSPMASQFPRSPASPTLPGGAWPPTTCRFKNIAVAKTRITETFAMQ